MTIYEENVMREQHGPISEQHGPLNERQSARHFGNYDLIRRIDVGGMGEVYLARQRTAFGREVAVKIIRSDLMHDVTVRQRFLREAEVSAHLKHEHILPLVEFGEEQGRLFLVTPYIQGGTLAHHLQNESLSLRDVKRLFTALVQAVAYIHKRGVIHRDLKPSNILLDREEGSDQIYVRLTDFGIASIQGAAASGSLTTAGNEIGTIAYMAPERANGVAAPSNDIYSLGVILYLMLTGQLPETGKMVTLPHPLERVVRLCTVPDPNQRFATADELLKAFEHGYKTLSTSLQGKQMAPVAPLISDPDEQFAPTSELEEHEIQEKVLQAEAVIPPSRGRAFSGDDYSAPTSFLGPSTPQSKQFTNEALAVSPPLLRPRRPQSPRRSPFVFISASIFVILLLISGLALFVFQTAISANITITPQVHSVSGVFTITANLVLHTTDIRSASIPANVLTSTQTGSQQGSTTGQVHCILGFIGCQPAVSFADIDTLATLIRPGIKAQIDQDLRKQVLGTDDTTVGITHYSDVSPTPTADPPVGTVSKTVTVTLKEQGFIEYVKTRDMQNMTRLLLEKQIQQKFGSHYALIGQLTQFGKPTVLDINSAGVVKLAVAAGGVARYQFSASEFTDIQNSIKGMKQSAAQAFLAKLPGLDPKTIGIHITYGDTLPSDVQKIKIVSVDPTNLPTVQLPTT